MCHKVPCYKKFVRITENVEGLKSPNLPKPDMMIKSPASSTRSKQKLFEPQVLSTSKTKLHKQPVTPQPSYKLRSAVPVSTSSSRNKYVFGEECLVCNKYELRYKNKDREEVREYPMLLTLDAPLEKIKKLLDKSEKSITNLIAAEFKYHDRCRKDLTRDRILKKEPKGHKSWAILQN